MNYPQILPSSLINTILNYVGTLFSTPIRWFTELIDSVGLRSYWLAFVFIFMLSRFFLVPLFGRALGHELDSWVGSDKAQKQIPKNDIDNDPYGGHI